MKYNITEAQALNILVAAWRNFRNAILDKPSKISYQTQYETFERITPEVIDALKEDSLKELAKGIRTFHKEHLSCLSSPIPIAEWMLKEVDAPKSATPNNSYQRSKVTTTTIGGIEYESHIAKEYFPIGEIRVRASALVKTKSDFYSHIYRIEWDETVDGKVGLVGAYEFDLSSNQWHMLIAYPFISDTELEKMARESPDGRKLIEYVVKQLRKWFEE